MIKSAIATTAALALMSGIAFAQAKTDGGAVKSNASPTSANSGASLSTGQTQPLAPGSYSTMSRTPGLNSVNGSNTGSAPLGGTGAADTGQSAQTQGSTPGALSAPGSTGSDSSGGSMPTTTASMPATPTMTSNMPTGDAPSSYPACTHKGQDRCMQRHKM